MTVSLILTEQIVKLFIILMIGFFVIFIFLFYPIIVYEIFGYFLCKASQPLSFELTHA